MKVHILCNRHIFDAFAYPLFVLINKIIDSDSVSAAWKLAEICPIFKKDNPHEKSNYDLMSILNLLAKLAAYGVSPPSLALLHSYLRDRSKPVRIDDVTSDVVVFYKTVPQVSVLGPLLSNIFLKDRFYFINRASLFNCPDDTRFFPVNAILRW